MGTKKYTEIYTDGSFKKDLNLLKWAYIIIKDDDIIHADEGIIPGGHGSEVEVSESFAIYYALLYCKDNPDNYRLYTDSLSVLDKINNNCNNCTHNPHIKGIMKITEHINASRLPQSITFKFCKRRSNKWMQEIDDRAYIPNDYHIS